MKRLLAVIFAAVFVLCSCEASADPVSAAADYLIKNADTPGYGSEWTMLALYKADRADGLADAYIEDVHDYVQGREGVLHATSYTEYSRVVYTLATLGEDTRDVGGYDITAALFDFESVTRQGVNGTAWALLALDAAGVADAEIGDLRERYIENILTSQNKDGSFGALVGSEVDMTAMSLRALGEYITREDVAAACERGIDYLASRQSETGRFPSAYGEACESVAQVMLALDACGFSHTDARFAYSLADALLSYQNRDGGFAHTSGGEAMRISTEQALWALVQCEIEVEE